MSNQDDELEEDLEEELEEEPRGTKYGYARVSTKYQSLDAQIKQLVRAGVPRANIVSESISSRKPRAKLEALLEELQEGDELHVTKLDRPARNNQELRNLADELDRRGVIFVFGGSAYNPRDPFGKMFFNMTAVFAEFERDLISARTRDSLAAIAESGGRIGRRPSTDAEMNSIINQMLEKGFGVGEVAKVTGVSRSTIYRVQNAEKAKEAAIHDPLLRRRIRELVAEDEKERAKSLAKFEKRVAAARSALETPVPNQEVQS